MTWDELLAAIRSYLDRPDLSDDDITAWIRSVEGELNRALSDHARSVRLASFRQPAGEGTLPLPPDVAQLVEVRVGGGALKQYPPTVTPSVAGFVQYGDCLKLFPPPAEDTLCSLAYHAFLEPITADGDANWVLHYFPDLYLYGALREAAVWLKDGAALGGWAAEFSRRLDGVQAQGWGQNIQTGGLS